MKTCPNCQHTVNDGYLFCPKCGTNLKNCHHCGKELPEGANFCPYCGKSAKVETTPAKDSAAHTQQDNVKTQVSKAQKQEHADGIFSLAAPKDFFEKNFISNDGIKRMRCKEVKEYNDDKGYSLIYYLDDSIHAESFASIIHSFETEKICFAECFCSGFNADGYTRYYIANTKEDIRHVQDEFGYPYIRFFATFCNRKTRKYCFSLTAHVNIDSLEYCIDSNLLDRFYLASVTTHIDKPTVQNNASTQNMLDANPVCVYPVKEAVIPISSSPEDSPLKGFYLTDEARMDITVRFKKMRDEVIPSNSGTHPEWKKSATMISLSETYKIWIGHEDTESESIQLTFSKVCMGIENVPWSTESEWPCSGQALIFDKSYSKGDDNSWDSHYSCATHKAWLLNEPYGMPGLWRFEYYSSNSRS